MDILFFTVAFLSSIVGAICGIGGGIVGRKLNKRLSNAAVDKLFIGLMVLIVAICVFNSWKAFGA